MPDEQLREILEQSRQMVPVDYCPTHQRYLTAQELDSDGCVPCVLEVLAGGSPLTAPDTWRGP